MMNGFWVMMKKMVKKVAILAGAIVLLGLAFGFGFYEGKKWEGYRLSRVVDGDTLAVINMRDGREMRLRIWAIDAPDQKQCFEDEARVELAKLVAEKRISYEVFGFDGYGRILAKVFADGADVGKMMVANGAARAYDAADVHDELKPSLDYVTVMRGEEDSAKMAKRGLWGSCQVSK